MDTIVEVGCWKGKSSHALCSGCRGFVTCVDHFQGSQDERDTYHKDAAAAADAWWKNVGSRFKNVKIVQRDSRAAAKEFNPMDMVFIDAGHGYDEVLADLRAWDPLATRMIAGHDYTNFAGVQQAVNEYFSGAEIRTHDSIWYLRK